MPGMKDTVRPQPELELVASPDWEEYELVDSGRGLKLERFGPYTFIRPEPQALWQPALPPRVWDAAHALFQPTNEESGGRWEFRRPVPATWLMHYKQLTFKAQATTSRHMGVFPEQAAHWDWIGAQIAAARRPVRVLNLFCYTGLATLAAAAAGAQVTHVDASRKAVTMAHENLELSGLGERPVRWIVDDALKFIQREGRRGFRYEGLILDPPKFGRGPGGEVWEFFDLFPTLLQACRAVLSEQPLFIVLTAYAIRASALCLYYALDETLRGLGGTLTTGELVTVERSAGRVLSNAIFCRWTTAKP